MKTAFKILFFSVLAGGAAYLAAYFLKQKQLLANTGFAVKKSTFYLERINKVNITLTTQVTNNSQVNFEIYQQVFDVMIGERKITSVENNDHIVLNAGGGADTIYAFSLNPMDVFSSINQSIKATSGDIMTVPLRLKGKISITAGMILINSLPVDVTFRIKDLLT